jgi:hypothetical protein
MSQRLKGKQPDHLAKLVKENHPRIGKKHSEEAKVKMSASRLGRKMPPRSEEYRRKLSERMKNRIVSEETKKKISLAKRKRDIDRMSKL